MGWRNNITYMKNYIEEHFTNKENIVEGKEYFDLIEPEQKGKYIKFKHVICKDNFTMSVQASGGAYCHPRITCMNSNYFIYDELEIGYPNRKETLLLEYAEDKKNPKQTVYAYVPLELINKVIHKHGGLKMGKDIS